MSLRLAPQVIGLCGRAGVGKDIAADFLVSLHYNKSAFARPLKEALNVMFGWTMAQWDDREWKETTQPDIGRSPRYLAQTLGTEWGRDLVHSQLWIKLAQRQLKRPAVFPDVRFENEAKFIHDNDGILIRIDRDVEAVNIHSSEGILLPFDHVINNNFDKGHLYDALLEIITKSDGLVIFPS